MRKIRAQYVFDGYTFRKLATVVIDDNGKIIEVQDLGEILEEEGVEFYNGIIAPGFVNAHCHLELSHMHNQIEQNSSLPNFISQVVKKRNELEFSLAQCEAADTLMQQNGIVAVGDISNSDESFIVKNKSKIIYHTFIELFDLHNVTSPIYEQGKQLFKLHHRTHKLSLSPHAPYSCSKKLMAKIAAHAEDYEYPVSIHNQEHASENDLYLNKTGELFERFTANGVDFSSFNATNKSSLQTFSPLFTDKHHLLLVHNVYTKQEDIEFIKDIRTPHTYTFVLCPLSNKFIGNVLPPIDLFIQNNVDFAIGTDSLASNTTLSILDEIKCLQFANPHISLEKLLFAATNQGARALQLNSKLGSFRAGKKPGVILLENVDLQNLKLTEETKVRVLV